MCKVEKQYNFMVCVRSLIYNHEKYVNDCLRGFMMQEVNFPVVFLLEDDASTDSTSQILSDWVNTNFNVEDKEVARVIDFEGAVTTFAQHRTNTFFYVAYIQMKYNHYGKYSRDAYNSEWRTSAKYEALCEGDDYWTDPLKLQKQVDYMDAHLDCALCFHRVKILTQETGELNDEWMVKNMPGKSTIEELSNGNYIHTPSVLFRKNEEVRLKLRGLGYCSPSDYAMWMLLAEHGYIYKFDEPMAVYRYGVGVWTGVKGIKNEVDYMMTLQKLWAVFDNETVKGNLMKSIMKQRQVIIDYELRQRTDLNNIRASKAYRIGKLLTAPATWWRKWKK